MNETQPITPTGSTPSKVWYKSKTILLMLVFILLPIIYMYMIKEPISLGSVLYASGQGMVAIILRLVTNQPISSTFLETVAEDAVEDLLTHSDDGVEG